MNAFNTMAYAHTLYATMKKHNAKRGIPTEYKTAFRACLKMAHAKELEARSVEPSAIASTEEHKPDTKQENKQQLIKAIPKDNKAQKPKKSPILNLITYFAFCSFIFSMMAYVVCSAVSDNIPQAGLYSLTIGITAALVALLPVIAEITNKSNKHYHNVPHNRAHMQALIS